MSAEPRRFWVHDGGRLKGPFDLGELARVPGLGRHTLLCLEGVNRRNRRNWRLAVSFPEVREVLSGARPPPRPAPAASKASDERAEDGRAAAPPRGIPWLAVAAAALLIATVVQIPHRARRPSAPPVRRRAPEAARRVAEVRLPACGRTLGQLAGGAPSLSPMSRGKVRVGWGGSLSNSQLGVAFEFNEATGAIRPLTPAAVRLLDLRQPCPSGGF